MGIRWRVTVTGGGKPETIRPGGGSGTLWDVVVDGETLERPIHTD